MAVWNTRLFRPFGPIPIVRPKRTVQIDPLLQRSQFVEFEPDLNLKDWGYGPYFHQTFLAREGDWFQLPEQPFPAGTWFNARDLGDAPHTLTIEVGHILDSPEGSIVILGTDREGLSARPEQPADMWCEAGVSPPLKPWQAIRIPWKALYTPTGHLRLSPAYWKGC